MGVDLVAEGEKVDIECCYFIKILRFHGLNSKLLLGIQVGAIKGNIA